MSKEKKLRKFKEDLAWMLILMPIIVGMIFMCFDRLQGANVKETAFPFLLGIVTSTVVKNVIQLTTNWLD